MLAQPTELPRWAALLPRVQGMWVDVGERYTSSGNIYQAIVAGYCTGSAPSTTSASIQDGSARWQFVAALAPAWVTGTAYAAGDTLTNAGNVYLVVSPGGGNSTVAPTGTSATSFTTADGYTWLFVAAATAVDTEPAEGFKDVGWIPGQRPPAQVENWRTWTVYRWLQWVRDIWALIGVIFSGLVGSSGVKLLAQVDGLVTLAGLQPLGLPWALGVIYVTNQYVIDPYGNGWYASTVTGGSHFSSATTWATTGIYPGATNTTDPDITWTCASLAGVTPSAPNYNISTVYTIYQLVTDVYGKLWFVSTANPGGGGGSLSFPTTALVVGTTTLAGANSLVLTLAGLGASQGVANGDTYLVPGYGVYRFNSAGGVTVDPDTDYVIAPTFPGVGAQKWVHVENSIFGATGIGTRRVRTVATTTALKALVALDGDVVISSDTGMAYVYVVAGGLGSADGLNLLNSTVGGHTSEQWASLILYSRGGPGNGPSTYGSGGRAYGTAPLTGSGLLPGGVFPTYAPTAIGGLAGGFSSGWSDPNTTDTSIWTDYVGMVHIKGRVTNSGAGGAVVFTLPVGSRPAFDRVFAVPDGSTTGTPTMFVCYIAAATGTVSLVATTARTYDLSGISFLVGQ